MILTVQTLMELADAGGDALLLLLQKGPLLPQVLLQLFALLKDLGGSLLAVLRVLIPEPDKLLLVGNNQPALLFLMELALPDGFKPSLLDDLLQLLHPLLQSADRRPARRQLLFMLDILFFEPGGELRGRDGRRQRFASLLHLFAQGLDFSRINASGCEN